MPPAHVFLMHCAYGVAAEVVLASLTSHLTSFVGDHGLYAVFAPMAIDAVLPAGSEVVMLYAGALAAGTFAGPATAGARR